MPWQDYNTIKGAPHMVPDKPGVVELRYKGQNKLLHIGKSNNLYRRIVYAFFYESLPHSVAERMHLSLARKEWDKVQIRWTETIGYHQLKNELQQTHINSYGELPEYDIKTQ